MSAWILYSVGLVVGAAGVLLLALSAVMTRGRRATDLRLALIERRLRLLMDHVGIADPEPEAADLLAHLVRGEKIQAIKLYRERTGVGLKEAKDAVEDLARRNGLTAR